MNLLSPRGVLRKVAAALSPDCHFVQRRAQLIVMLAGGSKRTQKADIKRAKLLAALLD